ncbi:hypothetical protein Micbo1qcDRAFT_205858 [Microdochium bolleyi]|uniref:Uncharacterized protein n=1 Tax=Microdochium bolleyi TaxID=196109 RepID=A0A136IZN0_9PEZI|nr:hypothetical protein Micbo1qcDRAFT_205858 [Microdochium bolleyi]
MFLNTTTLQAAAMLHLASTSLPLPLTTSISATVSTVATIRSNSTGTTPTTILRAFGNTTENATAGEVTTLSSISASSTDATNTATAALSDMDHQREGSGGGTQCIFWNHFLWLDWEMRGPAVDNIPGLCGGLWDNLRDFKGCDPITWPSCGQEADSTLVWRFSTGDKCPAKAIELSWERATYAEQPAMECEGR